MDECDEDFIQSVVKSAFYAVCLNFEMKDYRAATEIVIYLEAFKKHFTESQESQLEITTRRLTYLLGIENANKPSTSSD